MSGVFTTEACGKLLLKAKKCLEQKMEVALTSMIGYSKHTESDSLDEMGCGSCLLLALAYSLSNSEQMLSAVLLELSSNFNPIKTPEFTVWFVANYSIDARVIQKALEHLFRIDRSGVLRVPMHVKKLFLDLGHHSGIHTDSFPNEVEEAGTKENAEASSITSVDNVVASSIPAEESARASAITTKENVEASTITNEENVEASSTPAKENADANTITTEENDEATGIPAKENAEASPITTEDKVEASGIPAKENAEASPITIEENDKATGILAKENAEASPITTEENDKATGIPAKENAEASPITTEDKVEASGIPAKESAKASTITEESVKGCAITTEEKVETRCNTAKENAQSAESPAETTTIMLLREAAAADFKPAIMALFSSRTDISVTAEGYNLLYSAVKEGCANTTRTLIELGAREYINAKYSSEDSLLHLAISRRYVDCAEVLLKSGADVNIEDYRGYTPLCKAAEMGDIRIVKMLCNEHVYINHTTKELGKTPLHLAAEGGHELVVKILLAKGTYLSVKAIGGYINGWYSGGLTPLHFAAAGGHTAIVNQLLMAGADPDVKASNFNTPLHLAAGGGHYRIVEALCNEGADVKARGHCGYTPRQCAAMKNQRAVEYFFRRLENI